MPSVFTGEDAIPVRLIVRRVRPTPGSQLALFTTWDYHAFVTNRPGQMVEVEARAKVGVRSSFDVELCRSAQVIRVGLSRARRSGFPA